MKRFAFATALLLALPILLALGPLAALAGQDQPSDRTEEAQPGKRGVAAECDGCEGRKNYDSVEVIRHVKEVDRSRVINTTTVIPYIRGPVVHVPIMTRVQFIVHRYEVEEVPYSYTYRRKILREEVRLGITQLLRALVQRSRRARARLSRLRPVCGTTTACSRENRRTFRSR